MVRLLQIRWFNVPIIAINIVILLVVLFSIFNNGKDIKNAQDLINELEFNGYTVESVEVTKHLMNMNGSHLIIITER